MRKYRSLPEHSYNPYHHASSKRAAAIGAREFTAFLISLLDDKREISEDLFDSPRQRARKFREMQRLGYITADHTVTKKGKYVVSEEKIWELTIPRPARWDGKWRMVLFDIPAKKSRARHSFRKRLKELGLILYQRSVWVYPYPLQKTIRAISDFYGISECVLFAVAGELNKEASLRNHFNV
jgi:hypothetical protein